MTKKELKGENHWTDIRDLFPTPLFLVYKNKPRTNCGLLKKIKATESKYTEVSKEESLKVKLHFILVLQGGWFVQLRYHSSFYF